MADDPCDRVALGGKPLLIKTRREAIARTETELRRASGALEFERAAELRDEIARLKRLLPDDRSPVSMAKTRPPATVRHAGR